jgi:hypothetical protein
VGKFGQAVRHQWEIGLSPCWATIMRDVSDAPGRTAHRKTVGNYRVEYLRELGRNQALEIDLIAFDS